jgi:hypothetical protein
MYKTQKQEQFSIAYIKAIAAPLGFNPGKYEVDDDSVDISFKANYPDSNIIRNPEINIQLKCTAMKFAQDEYLHYPLKIKNYDDLRGTNCANPQYLVVVCIPASENEWIDMRESELVLRYTAYWYSLKDCLTVENETSVTIKIPKQQRLDKQSFKMLMDKASEGIRL